MSVSLPLKMMSIEEKIQTMELLWNDLCEHADNYTSPKWHEDLLKARADSIQQGKAEYTEWEGAKESILKSLK